MMKIGFFDNGIGFRGTTRAMHEYAKVLLQRKENVSCHVFFNKNLKNNKLGICRDILKSGVEVIPIEDRTELNEYNLDWLYHITSASEEDNKWLDKIRTNRYVHQVGVQSPQKKYCELFSYVSHWQDFYHGGGGNHILPHILKVNEAKSTNNRARYAIPENALVIGRHGGLDTWNLPFASKSVYETVQKREDIWFLFMNTPKFINHPRVIFLDSSSKEEDVEEFINTCDAMIHARWEGETFGLACAEFLLQRKPIITWSESRERNHITLADRSILIYDNENELTNILVSMSKESIERKRKLIPINSILKMCGQESVGKELCRRLGI